MLREVCGCSDVGLRASPAVVAHPQLVPAMTVLVQGLCEHVVATFGTAVASERGIVIGFDHRARGLDGATEVHLSSLRFALLTAVACLSRGIKVHIFNKLVCTPMVPFAIQEVSALAGMFVSSCLLCACMWVWIESVFVCASAFRRVIYSAIVQHYCACGCVRIQLHYRI